MLGVDRAANRRRKHDAATFLEPDEGFRPGGIVGRDVCPGDGDEASTFAKTCERRGDVPERRVGHLSIDMDRHRKWRIHQHDARHDAGVEVIVDVGGIKTGYRNGGEKLRENPGTILG